MTGPKYHGNPSCPPKATPPRNKALSCICLKRWKKIKNIKPGSRYTKIYCYILDFLSVKTIFSLPSVQSCGFPAPGYESWQDKTASIVIERESGSG